MRKIKILLAVLIIMAAQAESEDKMKARVTYKCNKCGERFSPGNKHGIPNGIGFVQKDNTAITLCRDCIMKLGEMSEKEKDEFFAELGVKTDGEESEE